MAALQTSKKLPAFQWLCSFFIGAERDDAMKFVGGLARQEGQGIRQRPRVLPLRSPLTDGATPLYN
jgi:hypothetical protein